MFSVLRIGDWQGCGGSAFLRISSDGIDAIRRREQLGLPASADGTVRFQVEQAGLSDRRAAESWPEGLNSAADLPLVVNRFCRGELVDMIGAGVLVPNGPCKINDDGTVKVGLSLKLACSPFELVCWRRAWAAEQRASLLEEELEDLRE